jgi:hypothetical protein
MPVGSAECATIVVYVFIAGQPVGVPGGSASPTVSGLVELSAGGPRATQNVTPSAHILSEDSFPVWSTRNVTLSLGDCPHHLFNPCHATRFQMDPHSTNHHMT